MFQNTVLRISGPGRK